MTRNKLTEEEFNEMKLELNQFDINHINTKKEFMREVSQFHECYLMYIVDKSKFVMCELVLKHELYLIINYYKNNYNIYNLSLNDYTILMYSKVKSIEEKYTSPAKIGKLTKKKIQDWIDYHVMIYNEVVDENNRRQQVINDFVNRMKQNPDVLWGFEKKSGSITKRGIVYHFDITKEGTISEWFSLSSDITQNYDTFLDLFSS